MDDFQLRKLVEQWRVRADALDNGEAEDRDVHDENPYVLNAEIDTLLRCAKSLEDVLNAPAEAKVMTFLMQETNFCTCSVAMYSCPIHGRV